MYAKKKSPIRASRTVRRRHRVTLFKVCTILVGVGAIAYCFSWLSQYPTFSIAAVSVAGDASSSSQVLVQQIAENDMSGSYLHLFSKSNFLLYPRSKIIADIRSADPQIAAVAVAMAGSSGGRNLSLTVTDRQPAYQWCAGPVSATDASSTLPDDPALLTSVTPSNSSCYLMDATGYVFAPSASTTSSFFTFYGRLDASSTPIGLQYLDPADFQALTAFISTINTGAAPQSLSSYALVDRADGVDELFLKSGAIIIFDDTEDLTTVSADIAALSASTPVFSYGSQLQYVDLRVGNKAFYKLVGSSVVGNTGTTSAAN